MDAAVGGAQLTSVAGAIRRYLDHLTVERGLAVHTLQAYQRDLQRYAVTLAARGRTEVGEVTTRDVADYLAGLREGDEDHPPLAASSAGRAVVAVRGLHAFAVAEGIAAADPARLVRPPAPPRRLPRAISIPEVERLLAAAGGSALSMSPNSRSTRSVRCSARTSGGQTTSANRLAASPVPAPGRRLSSALIRPLSTFR